MTHQGSTLLAAHNLSDEPVTALLDLSRERPRELEDLLVERAPLPCVDGRVHVELERYGHAWFRVVPGHG